MMINIDSTAIEKIKDSIDKTNERAESEGFTGTDETLEILADFCDFLLADSADPGARRIAATSARIAADCSLRRLATVSRHSASGLSLARAVRRMATSTPAATASSVAQRPATRARSALATRSTSPGRPRRVAT